MKQNWKDPKTLRTAVYLNMEASRGKDPSPEALLQMQIQWRSWSVPAYRAVQEELKANYQHFIVSPEGMKAFPPRPMMDKWVGIYEKVEHRLKQNRPLILTVAYGVLALAIVLSIPNFLESPIPTVSKTLAEQTLGQGDLSQPSFSPAQKATGKSIEWKKYPTESGSIAIEWTPLTSGQSGYQVVLWDTTTIPNQSIPLPCEQTVMSEDNQSVCQVAHSRLDLEQQWYDALEKDHSYSMIIKTLQEPPHFIIVDLLGEEM